MRQEIASYLSTIKKEMYDLSKFLYDNPEGSFKETKAQDYISKLLLNKGFKVSNNYMDISTAFHAKFGDGHPKICFLCDYDADIKKGHIYGNNLSTCISIASALSLAKVIPKTGGSVIVMGTPGELTGGSKKTLERQGAFEDMDVIFIAKLHTGNHDVTLPELPNHEIKLSQTLNRLFAHNLKESGIIEIETANCASLSSTLECISDTIPSINSYISIVKDKTITYPSSEFAKETLSEHAQDIALKVAEALALTGLDLIEKQDLLMESKCELTPQPNACSKV